jgi:hypothetical protein
MLDMTDAMVLPGRCDRTQKRPQRLGTGETLWMDSGRNIRSR